MKWAVCALLALILAWLFVPEVAQDDVLRPNRIVSATIRTLPHAAPAAGSRLQHVEKASTQTCEVIAAQGAHVASTVEDARSGAAEDVRDVCPSSELTQVLEKCAEQPIQNAGGVMEMQYRCVQSGNWRICGDDLARRKEVLDEREK